MTVISVRIPDDLHKELRIAGVKVSDVVRDDLTKRAIALRVKRREDILSKYRRPASKPVADLVREIRDEH